MKIKWSSTKTKDELKRFYLSIIPIIRKTAKKYGYAIGVHGSLTRDLDLIAAPWTAKAAAPIKLMEAIENLIEYKVEPRKCELKPHGRMGCVIYCGSNAYIDLSVMPIMV